MSKLSRVEQELVTLSPTNFQKLGDTYLHRLRGWRIQSQGTMVGADKDRTGVPDAWCQLPDGRLVLLAYTTADKDLPAKLQKDLADCITRTQPAITPAQVERICLVFNRRCSPETAAILFQQAQVAGYLLELIGLDELAREILQDPALAVELIGLDLGSGQLIHADDFIGIHQRQVGSTPFAKTLIGREVEQANLLTQLIANDLVLVTGPAGVGKTQLVLTTAQTYCAELPTRRQLYFVFDKKSPDFIHELHLALRPGQQVVVVADDANCVSPYFTALLAEQLARPVGTLKIVATVREYAQDSVEREASKNPHTKLEIQPLSDEAIKELIAAEPYCIHNGDYVQRIQELSAGRPRLAVMAAQAARQTERLHRLHNVRDIYEGYFGPALDELATRQNPLLGQVLALMHFFRVVHQTDNELAQRIETAFGITPKQFWEAVQALHNAELVEMHEGRIAKTADQILGNYVFYKIFFSDHYQLSYFQLLQQFFLKQQRRVIDTLNGSINDFTLETVRPRVQPAIEAWITQPDLSEDDRWRFYHVFWPFLIPQIIAEATQQLAANSWPAFDATTYPVPERNNHSYLRESPLFQTLEALCRHAIDELPIALRLLIEFTVKHPDHFGKALGFLQGIARFSGYEYNHQSGLHVQETVVKVLRIGVNSALHAAFYRWLIAHIIPSCLATTFRGSRASYKANTILLTNDELPSPTDYLKNWRESLWMLLFSVYPTHPQLVLNGVNTYMQGIHDGESSVYWHHWDADLIIPFLDVNLNPADFTHCYLVQQYCGWYHWYKKAVPHSGFAVLKHKFYSPLYQIYDLLIYQHPYKRYTERTFRRFYKEDERDAYIRNRTKPLQYQSFPPYAKLIGQFNRLAEQLLHINSRHNELHQLPNSIAEILYELIERDRELAKQVIIHLFSTGNPVGLTPLKTICALAQYDAETSYQLISEPDYQSKSSWQLLFLKYLPANQVSPHWLQELLRVFKNGPTNLNIHNLEHFEPLSVTLYPDLIAIALDAAEQDSSVQLPWGVIGRFNKFFDDDQLPLLIRYYKWWDRKESYFDWDGEDLATLLKRRPDFFSELLDFNDKSFSFSRYDNRPLGFLWQDESLEPIIADILPKLVKQDDWTKNGIMKSLFPKDANSEQKDRMLNFIWRLIRDRPEKLSIVRMLFKAVRRSITEQLMPTLELIFATYPENPDQLFERLSLFSSSRTTGRSWIPIYESDNQVWEQVVRTIDSQQTQTFVLLDYRQYALSQINNLNKKIAEEAARNFADPY